MCFSESSSGIETLPSFLKLKFAHGMLRKWWLHHASASNRFRPPRQFVFADFHITRSVLPQLFVKYTHTSCFIYQSKWQSANAGLERKSFSNLVFTSPTTHPFLSPLSTSVGDRAFGCFINRWRRRCRRRKRNFSLCSWRIAFWCNNRYSFTFRTQKQHKNQRCCERICRLWYNYLGKISIITHNIVKKWMVSDPSTSCIIVTSMHDARVRTNFVGRLFYMRRYKHKCKTEYPSGRTKQKEKLSWHELWQNSQPNGKAYANL